MLHIVASCSGATDTAADSKEIDAKMTEIMMLLSSCRPVAKRHWHAVESMLCDELASLPLQIIDSMLDVICRAIGTG